MSIHDSRVRKNMIDYYFGSIGVFISFSTSLVAILLSILVIRRNERYQREKIASDYWKEYEKLALQYPQFSLRNDLPIDLEAKTFNGCKIEFKRYQWFVSFMLTTLEEIYSIKHKNNDWRRTIEHQIIVHNIFLFSEYFKDQHYEEMLSPKFRRVFTNLRDGKQHN